MPKIDISNASDMALVELTRSGINDAYAELWKRHSSNLTVAIRCFTGFDADDIAQETFMRILQQIQAGKGPQTAFRAYAMMTARNIATNMSRSNAESEITGNNDDVFELSSAGSPDIGDTILEKSFTYQVFNTLPTRWQEVLWYREVEDLPVKDFCVFLGMSENSTSALLLRAREGFKQAWIAANLEPQSDLPEGCRRVVEKLPQLARGKASAAAKRKLDAHLVDCRRCSILAGQSEEVHSRLALVLLPGILGGVGAQQFVAWLQSGASLPAAAESFAAALASQPSLLSPEGSLAKAGAIKSFTTPMALISAGALAATLALSATAAAPTTAPISRLPGTPTSIDAKRSEQTAEDQNDNAANDQEDAAADSEWEVSSETEAASQDPILNDNATPSDVGATDALTPPQPAAVAPSPLSAIPADGIEVGVYPRLVGSGAPHARIDLTVTNERGEAFSQSIVADGQGRWVFTPTKLMGTITVTGVQTYLHKGSEVADAIANIGTYQVGRGLAISVEQTAPQQTTIRVTGLDTPTLNQVVNIQSTALGALATHQPATGPGEYVLTVPYARSELGDLRYWQGNSSVGPQRVWWRMAT